MQDHGQAADLLAKHGRLELAIQCLMGIKKNIIVKSPPLLRQLWRYCKDLDNDWAAAQVYNHRRLLEAS